MIMGILLLLLVKRAVGLFGLDVDCGGSVKSDFCVSCAPSAFGCGGDCVWMEERSLCVQDKGNKAGKRPTVGKERFKRF